ncbi:MAG: insulinase family protein [Capnocytophaga sp.]|nr:insulinase family protein [Capnocytophaga sp.]
MRKKIFYYTILFFFFIGKIFSQGKTIALPDNTTKEVLHNGFSYVIMPNDIPKGRVEVRLCLNVGSFLENKGEEGVAHFIEHLAFKGSKHYPNDSALKFWESLGAKYGETLNAYTTDDRTVYSVSLSNVSQEQINKTIHILADWLSHMSINEEDIEKERKIITEEIASYTTHSDLNPIKLGYNERLTRLPIGTKEQIKEITRKELLEFYQNYYLPRNATLIIIGDIETKATKKAIEESFTSLINTNDYIFPEITTISFTNQANLSIQKGKNRKEKLALLYPKMYKGTNWRSVREDYFQKVIFEVLKNRFKAAKKDISIHKYWYLQALQFIEIEITSDNIKKDLKEAFSIIEGLKNTITQAEIDNATRKIITNIRKIPTQRPSEEWAMSFIDAFLFKESFIATEKDKEDLVKEIQKIDVTNWETLYSSFLMELPRYLFASVSPIAIYTTDNNTITYKEIQELIAEGTKQPITILPEDKKTIETTKTELPKLLSKQINDKSEEIKEEKAFEKIGIHRVKLKNGATIYLKPTKNDKNLNITLLFKGGYSLLPQKNFKQYEDILQYVHLGGIGKPNTLVTDPTDYTNEVLKGEKYEEMLYENELTFLIGTESYHHMVMGTSPIDKSNILCNLISEKLLFPEYAEEPFEDIKAEELASFASRPLKKEKDPLKKMAFEVEDYKGGTYPLTNLPKRQKDIQKIQLKDLFNYYKQYFLSSEDLLCIVTGSFDVEKLKKELVGTLSKFNPQEKPFIQQPIKEVQPSFKAFQHTENGRTDFNIIYKAPYEKSLQGVLSIKLLKEILQKEIIAEIREKKGWVYTPYVNLDYYSTPKPIYSLVVSGETEEKNFKKVKNRVIQIINRIVKGKNIDNDALTAIKRSFIVAKNESLTDDNAYNWRTYLIDCFKNNISLEELEAYENILENITIH